MTAEEQLKKQGWQKRLFRVTQVLVMLAAAFLLGSHVAKWDALRVDGIALALLGFILLIPLAELIRRVKIGDFEAEIGRDEIARVQAKASFDLAPPDGAGIQVTEDRIRALLREDPRLALAKVRIELEEALKRLHSASADSERDTQRLSLGRLVEQLVRNEVLTQPVGSALRDVIALANRAVHGEAVDPMAAEDLALLGVRLLREVHQVIFERILRPAETSTITQDAVEEYTAAKYRVTTVVPVLDRPIRNTYILDQEALDEFLEGYEEYAEFLVSIEAVSK